ncbi:MAG: hypothetical protein HDT33_10375 [Clostridiales bacterium]|nr:hypothetical protein [Clostridiales bacterium]
MEWRKLKNLIILILLTVNGFLLVLVGIRREESARYERSALEQTVQVLEQGGIQVDVEAIAAADGLAPMTVERDVEREARLVSALLDEEVQGDNRGGGLYLYQGKLGEVSLRAGGELSADFPQDNHWKTDHPEDHAAALLKKLGVEGALTDQVNEGEDIVLRFRQSWNGAPVFSCEVEFMYRDGWLRALRGTLLMAVEGTVEAGQTLTLPTALMRFSEGLGATGDVCSAIRAMEPGYRGTAQSLSGGARLTPVWLVTTDTANYYLDCVSGALTRAADQ